MKTLAITSLGIGVGLMALSFFWPRVIHDHLVEWNKREIAQANDAMGIMHSSHATDEDRASAREVHRVATGNVNSRIRIRDYGVWISRSLGILLTAIGVGFYLRMRAHAANGSTTWES